MEKNPAFSNKLGIKNISEYLSEKEQKNERHISEWVSEGVKKCYRYYLQFVWSGL